MSETRKLLEKISALREQLDQAQGLVDEARNAAASLVEEGGSLDSVMFESEEHDEAMDSILSMHAPPRPVRTPPQLSSRARRVLERGRDLLAQLRALGEQLNDSPLVTLYRDTVSMMDTAVRTVALLPDSISTQMHLCRGLEVTLEEVAGRLRTILVGNERRHRRAEQIDRLAAFLYAIDAGQPIQREELYGLAEEIVAEARSCEPLYFLEEDPTDVARFAACHGLTVARVLSRIVRQDPDLRIRIHDVVLTGLLHDVGMLRVPSLILQSAEPLDAEARRVIEAHAHTGAASLRAAFPQSPWIAEAVEAHHERTDGTGYPAGLRQERLSPMACLLAVADVYAAMCCGRPHRPARATRTALADTLLMADQGELDRTCAGYLLSLSFYPVGTVVELAQGEIGVVVATPGSRGDLGNPARPVIALLTDRDGHPLPHCRHLDLAEAEDHSIVRPLSASERRHLLATRFPEWAA